jgi:hypothetical protein
MDENEIAELRRLSRHVRIKPIWVAVPLTLWFWPMFFSSVAARSFPPELFMKFTLVLLGSVTIYWEWQVFAGMALSRQLIDDAAAGYVLATTDEEKLPVSGMEWTVSGAAAPWRGHAPPIPEPGPPNA